jgi:hypothetical protein
VKASCPPLIVNAPVGGSARLPCAWVAILQRLAADIAQMGFALGLRIKMGISAAPNVALRGEGLWVSFYHI